MDKGIESVCIKKEDIVDESLILASTNNQIGGRSANKEKTR